MVSSSTPNPQSWTLAELAAESGVPARTVRFYIARGLLSPPARGGRGAFYTEEHLKLLGTVGEMQRQGLTLTEIGRRLAPGPAPRLPEPSCWWRYPIADDVVVEVRAGASPWRMNQVRAALAALTAQLEAK